VVYFLAALALVAAGLDCYVTYTRMKKYGNQVELNPVVRAIADSGGLKKGVIFLGCFNLGVTAALFKFGNPGVLGLWAGFKSALGVLQLKSLT
jgi:hypothetical protein